MVDEPHPLDHVVTRRAVVKEGAKLLALGLFVVQLVRAGICPARAQTDNYADQEVAKFKEFFEAFLRDPEFRKLVRSLNDAQRDAWSRGIAVYVGDDKIFQYRARGGMMGLLTDAEKIRREMGGFLRNHPAFKDDLNALAAALTMIERVITAADNWRKKGSI